MKKGCLFSLFLVATLVLNAQLPKLSRKEQKEGWYLLFDGTSSKGWKKADGKPFPAKGWKFIDGVMLLDTAAGRAGDIVTEESFSDFELSLEFKITDGSNSGIKYFVFPNSSLGCEFQILDDDKHPDAKMGKDGNRKQGGLYDLIAPAPTKKDKPVGEWNVARIVSKGSHVEHWLNGVKVVEYERGSPEFKALVAGSKYKNNKGFGEVAQSPILLQDHGDTVAFRNIKIRKL